MPPIKSRSSWHTGVDTTISAGVAMGIRQNRFPLAGSRLVTDAIVQTMSCRVPPTLVMSGELYPAPSPSALQIS